MKLLDIAAVCYILWLLTTSLDKREVKIKKLVKKVISLFDDIL